jgi:hypothetical protein
LKSVRGDATEEGEGCVERSLASSAGTGGRALKSWSVYRSASYDQLGVCGIVVKGEGFKVVVVGSGDALELPDDDSIHGLS